MISCIVDAFLCSLLYCTSAESYYTELHCTELYWTVPYSTELVLYFSATNLVFWIAHMHISLLLTVSFLSYYLSVICPWLLSSFLIIYIQITIESVSFLSLIYTAPLPPPGFILFVTVHFSCNFPTYCSTILSFLSSPLHFFTDRCLRGLYLCFLISKGTMVSLLIGVMVISPIFILSTSSERLERIWRWIRCRLILTDQKTGSGESVY